MTPISGKKRLQKPKYEKGDARVKLIRYNPADLQLVERAAKSLDPAPTSSYFVMLASLEKARRVLNLPA